ncbi:MULTISPECIES: HNH endonuclease [Idiomarina]|uniref:HNH endonuclease n=1 Tax=Idiomarina abyssalis TaxID=86102 RepID=A0A8I1G2V1_9GAMM|nr:MULTISPECIES: HNH endonuclease [Idiomarina]MBJ7267514.1 HNH endonuclease [Idiomarina abyssalis]MBJ7273941.1 HNH endonuclease [Idiomarina abyssalis]MBJ7314709.1 HNH endonuclease [Idiomarina abyssalis]MBP58793.1 HNH endonuclease [Idiomarina sp.]|tara:strand:+ start:2022 stop:2990 length:969 start_codon:yes stop_codon:yes gene_type:complete
MARRSKRNNPEKLRAELVSLLTSFKQKLVEDNLREQVLSLVPANYLLRDLGSSLLSDNSADSARDRILAYFRKYPSTVLRGEELMVVAGISEYARRIRELRVEMGWPIQTGQALKEMAQQGESLDLLGCEESLKKDTYVLIKNHQDREAAFRWNLANKIRKSKTSVKSKIIEYLRENIGKEVIGEELKYLASGRSEWARRVRELRTEDGWPIATRVSGRPDLEVGVYVLEEDKQAKVHDRKIPDPVRIEVLERDNFTCKVCNWSHENRNRGDRYRNLLELHHIEHHSKGGKNEADNLITLCNICHDEVHRNNISNDELLNRI